MHWTTSILITMPRRCKPWNHIPKISLTTLEVELRQYLEYAGFQDSEIDHALDNID